MTPSTRAEFARASAEPMVTSVLVHVNVHAATA
jgi:hypothetical protein